MFGTECSSLQLNQSVLCRIFIQHHWLYERLTSKLSWGKYRCYYLYRQLIQSMFHDLYIDYLQLFKSHYWLPLPLHLQEQWTTRVLNIVWYLQRQFSCTIVMIVFEQFLNQKTQIHWFKSVYIKINLTKLKYFSQVTYSLNFFNLYTWFIINIAIHTYVQNKIIFTAD